MTLLNLISTDPDHPGEPLLSEEEQTDVYNKWKGFGEHEVTHKIGRKEETKIEYLQPDWKYVFSGVKDEQWRNKLVNLFEELDKNPEE